MKKRIKVSSGDKDGTHPYMLPEFWINPANWFWCNSWYTHNAQADLWDRLVAPALKEIDKKTKEDLIPK